MLESRVVAKDDRQEQRQIQTRKYGERQSRNKQTKKRTVQKINGYERTPRNAYNENDETGGMHVFS